MKFKKRYMALLVFAGLFVTCRMDFLQFRTPELELRKQIMESGEVVPSFQSYEIAGCEMNYVRTGADSLPLVLMLHGSPGSANNMLGYLKDRRLLESAQVVAVDRPGFGYSCFGKAEPSVEKQAASIKPIIEKHARGKGLKTILVGHSFGGPVIARLAMDFPELVDGLVMVAGSIDPELEPKKWYQKPLDWWWVRWMLPPAARVCNQEILPLPAELEKMLPLWKNIHCPVTVVQGMNDSLVPSGNADFAKRMLVNSRCVLIDTLTNQNHFILWSHQNRIVDRIIELIKE